MKTTKKLAYFCVAVLSDVFCLTSCTSEEVNPNYDAERGVVKTEFTISIPAKPAGTRMSEATVQGQTTTPVFRGIEGIKLYPFKSKKANISGSTDLPVAITLRGTGSGAATPFGPSGVDDNKIDNSDALYTGNNSHLYQDIEVAIGTQAFMIYGVAMPSKVNPTTSTPAIPVADLASNGTLTDNLETASTLDDITFSPVPIHSSADIDTNGNGPKIARYLTNIANTPSTVASPNDKWSTTNSVVLRTLYNQFITMKAGSWASVKGAVQQLYSTLHERNYTNNGGTYEATSYATTDFGVLAKAIMDQILADDKVADSNNDGTLEFTDDAYDNYPADIHLPDGAAYVLWNGTAFQAINFPGATYDSGTVLTSGTSLAGYYTKSGDVYTACLSTDTADGTTTYYKRTNKDNTGLDIPNLSKFVYPAPLYYRALSDIRTANASKKSVYEDSSNNTWSKVLTNGYDTSVAGTSDVVLASTRSIAIVDQVQYAVGRLDAIVYTQGGITTLKDNENKDIYIMTGSTYNFPITGILIGGQKAVDYKFEQITTGDAYTIYDNDITGIYMTESSSNTATHTLAFETKGATVADDPNCVTKISVEFQNNSGKLFVGKDGEIIYPGSKFYLVGAFDPYLNTSVKYADKDEYIKKTFVQDYVTTAKLEVASLKNAYNTMPDLRAPQLELGLSVDLTWNPGITQTVIIQ